jgi:hypothetical protein
VTNSQQLKASSQKLFPVFFYNPKDAEPQTNKEWKGFFKLKILLNDHGLIFV